MAAPVVDLSDVEVDVVVELGRWTLTLGQARRARAGDDIEVDKLAGEALDLLVNGRAFAAGETVVVGDTMALRITRMVPLAGAGDGEVSP